MRTVTAKEFIAAMLCPRTVDTQASRHDFHFLLEAWNLMPVAEQAVYAKRARGMNYKEFTQSRYWAILRDEILHRFGRCCRTCRSQCPPFEVHHLSYEHRGIEFLHLDDLTVLCWLCHGARHGALTKDQISAWSKKVYDYSTGDRMDALRKYATDRPFPALVDRIAEAKRMK